MDCACQWIVIQYHLSRTYVNRAEPLLHVVRCQNVQSRGKPKEQVVLETEDRCWANQGGLGKEAPSDLFTTSLMYH
jgi:hypothetical protein